MYNDVNKKIYSTNPLAKITIYVGSASASTRNNTSHFSQSSPAPTVDKTTPETKTPVVPLHGSDQRHKAICMSKHPETINMNTEQQRNNRNTQTTIQC